MFLQQCIFTWHQTKELDNIHKFYLWTEITDGNEKELGLTRPRENRLNSLNRRADGDIYFQDPNLVQCNNYGSGPEQYSDGMMVSCRAGPFLDIHLAQMLSVLRLHHIAGTKWYTKYYVLDSGYELTTGKSTSFLEERQSSAKFRIYL